MAGNKPQISEEYDLSAKWDACLDLTARRFVYSSAAGAFVGLLLFRTPVTRWGSVAFGAGVGLGRAYTECSHKFGSPFKWGQLPQDLHNSSLSSSKEEEVVPKEQEE